MSAIPRSFIPMLAALMSPAALAGTGLEPDGKDWSPLDARRVGSP